MKPVGIACLCLTAALLNACTYDDEASGQCPDGWPSDLAPTSPNDPDLHELGLSGCEVIHGDLDMRGFQGPVWPKALGRIQVVDGSIFIGGHETNALLENIDMSRLVSIGGVSSNPDEAFHGLVIDHAPTLRTVAAFPALETIQGDLVIRNTELLTSIGEFPRLSDLKSIRIEGNDKLHDIGSFGALVTLHGDLVVSNNADLEKTPTLGALETVDGSVLFEDNARLKITSAFGFLRTIEGDLRWSNNPMLRSIEDMPALLHVQNLIFDNNFVLEGLPNLDRLERVYDTFAITDNPKLSERPSFQSLNAVGYLQVTNNPRLATGFVLPWPTRMDITGDKEALICGNQTALACEDTEEENNDDADDNNDTGDGDRP